MKLISKIALIGLFMLSACTKPSIGAPQITPDPLPAALTTPARTMQPIPTTQPETPKSP